MLTICWQRQNMFLRVSVLILYHIHGKCLILKKYISTVIEGEKAMMTVKEQTHFRLMTVALQYGVFEFASSFNFTYLLRARELLLFFVLLHTPSFSLGFLMFVSFHQSSSDAFMQTHSPLSSQCLSLSAASTLIQYGLQALDTAQLPDSDEHILISYKSSPHREEAVQTQERKRHCK